MKRQIVKSPQGTEKKKQSEQSFFVRCGKDLDGCLFRKSTNCGHLSSFCGKMKKSMIYCTIIK